MPTQDYTRQPDTAIIAIINLPTPFVVGSYGSLQLVSTVNKKLFHRKTRGANPCKKNICVWLFFVLLTGPAISAQRALEGYVETRIGTLEFDLGFPTDETVTKLYNELDFQRAVQAYLWALPLVEMAEWKRAQTEVFGAGPYDFVTYLDFKQRMGILTANATTPYVMTFPNLKETGPLVYELPAGPTAGGFMDVRQRPITDLGRTGPDEGQGTKVLILGPEHEEMHPDGYLVYRSPMWNIMVASRVLHPDPVESKKLMAAHKLYPYAQRNDPPRLDSSLPKASSGRRIIRAGLPTSSAWWECWKWSRSRCVIF